MRVTRFVLPVVVLISVVLAGCQTFPWYEKAPPAANVKLPSLFTDNMVLQQGMKVPVWGWADAGGRITVSIGGQKVNAIVGEDGRWHTELPPFRAGGPYELTVAGEKTIALRNVMVGELWVCSGQSNMQWPVKQGNMGVMNRDQEVASANYPNMRLFTVPRVTSFTPREDTESDAWQVCSPQTVPGFSAVAYFFGRYVHEHLGVPVGLIHTSWGGTVAEAWTSESALRRLPDFAPGLDRMAKLIPRLPEIEKEYRERVRQWRAGLEGHDAGYDGDRPVWADAALDAAGWATMKLPQHWDSAGLPEFDGFMWFRKEVDVPASWAGRQLFLHLGPINDMDRTWWDGFEVGRFEVPNQWTAPRLYIVPGDVVKAGRNVIVVRVQDVGSKGGICGKPEDLELELCGTGGAEVIALAGEWRYKPGLDMKDAPPQPQRPAIARGNPNVPTVLHNAMIHPLIPDGIRGAIWYQGESNASRAYQYRTLFPTMIRDWRAKWGQGDFPFLFVQLANWKAVEPEPGESDWAELREAQLMTLALPNTGMAVTIDIGEADNIHPQNKQDVGKRLGLAARHVAYGETLVYSGPIYRSMRVERNTIRLRFDHVGSGLVAKDGALTGFAIAGTDKKFVWADARIDGDTVVVSSSKVLNPVAVRYAWAINPVCNLYNKEGLPASPFRTDSWPGVTEGKK